MKFFYQCILLNLSSYADIEKINKWLHERLTKYHKIKYIKYKYIKYIKYTNYKFLILEINYLIREIDFF